MTGYPRPFEPGLIVRTEDWPHGLRCGECNRVLKDGDRYAERLTGMVDDAPAVMIVCGPCGLEAP